MSALPADIHGSDTNWQHTAAHEVQYLCEIPQGGPEQVERAKSLRQMLCRPFGDPRNKTGRLELSHLDWHMGSSIPFHWEQNFERIEGPAAEALVISKHKNAFLGNSSSPSGWSSPPAQAIMIKDSAASLQQ